MNYAIIGGIYFALAVLGFCWMLALDTEARYWLTNVDAKFNRLYERIARGVA